MAGLPEMTPRIPPTSTHPVIQCVLQDDLKGLQTLLKDNDIDGLYPCTEMGCLTPLAAAVVYDKMDIAIYLLKEKGDLKTGKHDWDSNSKRWKDKFERLVHCLNTYDSKVIRIGSVAYIDDVDFRIAEGSDGTEVFVGLREDGCEIAVKRMHKSNFQVLKKEQLLRRIPKLHHRCVVKCVDSAEDKDFGYLFLQLCEYTLEEHIRGNDGSLCPEDLVCDVLHSLRALHCEEPRILHRHLTPQNVLIDVEGRARLAGFGMSRLLPKDQTTYQSHRTETDCWMATECLKEDDDIQYTTSTDVQVAGMMTYFILSGGHHPFGEESSMLTSNIREGEYTLDHVKDAVAKDLIKRMLEKEPQTRPTVEECLNHPFFWTSTKKVEYLRKVANKKEVASRQSINKELLSILDEYAEGVSYTKWKNEFSPKLVRRMEKWIKEPYPDNVMGLLRFMRNVFENCHDEEANVDLLSLFPHLFGCVYQFTIRQGWNLEHPLKTMFIPDEEQRYY
ncbi:serine/threonine-protein kinase/endoribonuclease IRE1-like [Limanda limanda]|uniref:serine/threonine-protein kinase/endoribonuclease IRE1-like n=1 Tax=Limanda limanda TaxID=27771 RepID=UPI0029C91DC5|nr:serine/threonine-protein kinase/endoribonuclease IRE1-like [Limanda limanda]